MAVPYKLYQNTREKSTTKGMWYARATNYGTKTTEDIVKNITQETVLTDVEVTGVVKALVRHINAALKDGKRVTIDELGTFKVGMKTTPAQTAKGWTPTENLKSLHLIFQPTVKVSADKKRTKSILSDVKVEEMQMYHVDKEETPQP